MIELCMRYPGIKSSRVICAGDGIINDKTGQAVKQSDPLSFMYIGLTVKYVC